MRARSTRRLPGLGEHRAGAAVIVRAHHEAARNGADAAFDDAGMGVENDGLDAGAGEQCLQPRQTYWIVGADQFLHGLAQVLCWRPRPTGLDRFCKPSTLACGRSPVKQAPAARVGELNSAWRWWQVREVTRSSRRRSTGLPPSSDPISILSIRTSSSAFMARWR